jgi:hypothetical protein
VLAPGTCTLTAETTGWGDPQGGIGPRPPTSSQGAWEVQLTISGGSQPVPSLSGVSLALLAGALAILGGAAPFARGFRIRVADGRLQR